MTRRMRKQLAAISLSLATTACGDDVTGASMSVETDPSTSTSTGAPDDTAGSRTSSGGDDDGDDDDDGASTGIQAGPTCGNGLVEAEEQCDDGNVTNDDGCSKLCREEYCGDGITQASEACDLGPDNADDSTCTAACQKNRCGDGLQGPAEACDDGNTDDDDGCGSDCTLETCGNGEVEAGEQCDDGNASDDDECTSLCAPPVCGDGITSPSAGEDCDDANPDNADACPNDCIASVCGDGITEGLEQCDDADANGDGISLCSAQCTLNVCGDGYLVPALESCDDGDATGDGISVCSPQCTLNVCGDAYHHASEGCDAGDRNGFVPCSTACAVVPEVVEMAMTTHMYCARYADGSVRCWGNDDYGALGIDPPPSEPLGDDPGEMPPPFASLGGPVVALSGRLRSMCAAREDGAVVCWGSAESIWFGDREGLSFYFYSGLFGPVSWEELLALEEGDTFLGDQPGELPPAPIPLGANATAALSASWLSACVITEDLALRCWGRTPDDEWPRLGYGSLNMRILDEHFPPPPVNLGIPVTAVAHSAQRTCVLGTDALVRCFGRSELGDLGQGSMGPTASGAEIDPPPVTDLGTTVEQIAGGDGLCALGTDGTVRCFGGLSLRGYDGETLGDDPGEMPPPPLDLGPDAIQSVVASSLQACVLTEVGDVRCWGGADKTWGYGNEELLGDEPGEMPPPPIELGRPAIRLFSDSSQLIFCALLEDYSVECWGKIVHGLERGTGTSVGVSLGDEPGDMPPPPLRVYD